MKNTFGNQAILQLFYNFNSLISFIKCCFTGLVPHCEYNAVSGELTSKFIKLAKPYVWSWLCDANIKICF